MKHTELKRTRRWWHQTGKMKNRRKATIAAVLVAGFIAWAFWPATSPLSPVELREIRSMISEESGYQIVKIRQVSRWRVYVQAGENVGFLSGGGEDYFLRRWFGKWTIAEKGIWIG